MPIIKPISELRNNFKNISQLCHSDGGPIYLTKNGKGDLVVMSIAAHEKNMALLELYRKLSVAEQESREGIGSLDHDEIMKALRERLDD